MKLHKFQKQNSEKFKQYSYQMGQSNSTTPIITDTHEVNFNYSRLLLKSYYLQRKKPFNTKNKQNNNNYDKHKNIDKIISFHNPSTITLYTLDKFQSLATDHQYVIERQERLNPINLDSEIEIQPVITNSNIRKSINNQDQYNHQSSNKNVHNPLNTKIKNGSRKLSILQDKMVGLLKSDTKRIQCPNYVMIKKTNQPQQKVKITNYFIDEMSMENYMSNLIKIKQVLSRANHLKVSEHAFNLSGAHHIPHKSNKSNVTLFQDFFILTEGSLFIIEREYPKGIKLQNRMTRLELKQNVIKALEFLCFICDFYEKIDNIYINPLDVVEEEGNYYLLDFKYNKIDVFEILLSTIQWIYRTNQNKIDSLEEVIALRKEQRNENNLQLPAYINELWNNFVYKTIERKQILDYVNRMRSKIKSLNGNIESFHACINFKKTAIFNEDNHSWILGKKLNQIYFYNIDDEHCCQVKIIRKKKKVDLSNIKLMFDPQDLQIKYVGENSKLILHATEFQLEKHSSLSDIEINYKLPVKFRYPCAFFDYKKGNIYILENAIYRYHLESNKLFQETKKISECIYLAKSSDCNYMIVRVSIDIFKNGIRVFLDNKQIELNFAVIKQIYDDLTNIRVDIKSVDFCKEIYKGVYLMLAHKNFWILDINFNVFFSYATINRIKAFYGFGKNPNDFQGEYAFQIFNQPFKVDFLAHQEGLNAKIKNDKLHVIGQISGNMYFFKYIFIPEAGSLKLIDYKPLIGSEDKLSSPSSIQELSKRSIDLDEDSSDKKKNNKERIIELNNQNNYQNNNIHENDLEDQKFKAFEMLKNSFKKTIPQWDKYTNEGFKKYTFNFHEQNLENYKHESWLYFQHNMFIIPLDLHLKSQKTNYEVQLLIPPIKCSLKELIEMHKSQKSDKVIKFKKQEVLLYFNRLIIIFQYITQHQLIHKNFSINHIYFDESNTLKLIGWSEPPRNWYVSDYKDMLLVFFNILTASTLEKLNEKILVKYERELKTFSELLYQKMISAFRAAKIMEKKVEVEKQLLQIKDFVLSQLSQRFLDSILKSEVLTIQKQNKPVVENVGLKQFIPVNQYIFSFQFNTHRLSMISIFKNKMKKMKCILDENSKEQLIFKTTDKHLWNEQKGKLFVFSASYKFYEIKINTSNFKQDTVVCEQYEYLPHNILQSSFIFVPNWGIFSVGGIQKSKDSQLIFNKIIYKFNDEKLTWESIGSVQEPLMNPNLVLSIDGTEIYCIGGEVNLQNSIYQMTIINLKDKKSINNHAGYKILSFVDPTYQNPLNNLLSNYPIKIYNLSKELSLFLIFYISNQKYYLRIFSLTAFSLDIVLETKNFSDDNKIISPTIGIVLNKGVLHILRQYGKYTKIYINKIDSLSLTHQNVYPERAEQIAQN